MFPPHRACSLFSTGQKSAERWKTERWKGGLMEEKTDERMREWVTAFTLKSMVCVNVDCWDVGVWVCTHVFMKIWFFFWCVCAWVCVLWDCLVTSGQHTSATDCWAEMCYCWLFVWSSLQWFKSGNWWETWRETRWVFLESHKNMSLFYGINFF